MHSNNSKYFIKVDPEDISRQCAMCYENNFNIRKCSGPCQNIFCVNCLKYFGEFKNCPFCQIKFQIQKATDLECIFTCPSNNSQCQNFKSQAQFQQHCSNCQFLSAEMRIEFQYKRRYLCSCGKQFKFETRDGNCSLCGQYSYCSSCEQCSKKYCISCRVIPCSKQQCPKGHELVSGYAHNYIACDLCRLPLQMFKSRKVYSDRNCDFDICQICYEKLPQYCPAAKKSMCSTDQQQKMPQKSI